VSTHFFFLVMLAANSLPSSTPDRATLRLVRVRMPRFSTSGSIPSALPCHNYYDTCPDEIGPLGNVQVTDAAELQRWLLVARAVTRDEAEKKGGCIQYVTPDHEVLYYCITDTDDEVYGRSYYLPLPPRRSRVKPCSTSVGSVSGASSNTSGNGCSDEESATDGLLPESQ
jgi:hypothetical protein